MKKKIDLFVKKYSNVRTREKYAYHLYKFAKFVKGINWKNKYQVSNTICQYRDMLAKQKQSKAYINLQLSCIFQYLDYYEVDFKKSGILYRIGKFDNTRAMSKEYFLELMSLIKKETGIKKVRDNCIFQILILYGVRKSAVINLQVKNLFEENGRHFVEFVDKGGKKTYKHLPDELYAEVRKLIESKEMDDYIFTGLSNNSRKKLSESSLNYILNSYHKKIKAKTGSTAIHSIRALSAYLLYLETNNIMDVKIQLNHSSLLTTYLYVNKYLDKRKDFCNEITKSLRSI